MLQAGDLDEDLSKYLNLLNGQKDEGTRRILELGKSV